jgi:hypothetical protein
VALFVTTRVHVSYIDFVKCIGSVEAGHAAHREWLDPRIQTDASVVGLPR